MVATPSSRELQSKLSTSDRLGTPHVSDLQLRTNLWLCRLQEGVMIVRSEYSGWLCSPATVASNLDTKEEEEAELEEPD